MLCHGAGEAVAPLMIQLGHFAVEVNGEESATRAVEETCRHF